MIDLKTDPTGAPSCSTRRKMAWAAMAAEFLINILVVVFRADGTAAVAAVWASLILACVGVVVYAVSRSVLDRLLIEAARIAGGRFGTGDG